MLRSLDKAVLLLSLLMFLIGLLLVAGPCHAGTIDPSRAAIIDMPISYGTLGPVYEKLDKLLSDSSTADVTLIISSLGGEVTSGVRLINKVLALRSKGVSVICYVQDMAASMAFQLLTQCSERHALTNSFLLWHGVRTSTQEPITAMVASSMSEDLKRMDDMVIRQLENSLTLTSKEIMHHFDRETLWSGLQLHAADPAFLTIEDAYPGVLELLYNKSVARSTVPSFSFFDRRGNTTTPVITHSIWRKYQYLLDSSNQ